jgi:hypothetical protein
MDAGTGWKRLVVMEGAEMAGATVGDATSFVPEFRREQLGRAHLGRVVPSAATPGAQ